MALRKLNQRLMLNILKNEADRLRLQSGMFNSVIVVSNGAVVLATSPESLDLVGVHLNSSVSKLAIEGKRHLYRNLTNQFARNLIILLSHPIYDKSGNYMGISAVYISKNRVYLAMF